MCIRQELSPADEHLGAGLADVPRLVGAHGHRGVGVLDGEGAAEAAALLGAGSSTRSMPRTARSSRARPVADAEHPQRVAGRVVGHPVREVRADVGHPEHVDEELGQLVGRAAPVRRRLRAGRHRRAADDRVLVPGRAGARPDGVTIAS